jgi:low affinity Fe/Cu permease
MKHAHREDPLSSEPVSAQERFRRFAYGAASTVGSPTAFMISCLMLVLWAASGPFFHFSDTWQLIINTSTTIITFLMVFLIQNTQNRDAKALHLKLDELIRCMKGARNSFVSLQEFSEEELSKLEEEFARLRDRAHKRHPKANGAHQPAGRKPVPG